jgi:hypothetical protein
LRSIFVHLWRTSEAEVSAALDRSYTNDGPQWLSEVGEDPYLYISFYRDGPLEDDSWTSRFSALGGPPPVSLIADVSGRHEGWPEAQSFVVKLLSEFEGVATDDGGLRLWSRDEVAEDRQVDGRRFGHWRH